jgi:hypothetical protein
MTTTNTIATFATFTLLGATWQAFERVDGVVGLIRIDECPMWVGAPTVHPMRWSDVGRSVKLAARAAIRAAR